MSLQGGLTAARKKGGRRVGKKKQGDVRIQQAAAGVAALAFAPRSGALRGVVQAADDSTGQRQRISIARAIVKDPPVLVLDEPTASLDAQTELELMECLGEWGRGRAIFIVTHRLSTIRRADQIVYLRDGRVLEAGSHDALMARDDGAYRRFVELERAGGERVAEAAS